MEVPCDFVVPSKAPWPEDAWGMNLGSRAFTIRNQEIYVKDRPDRVAELNRMGFIWNIFEEHWQRTLKSLQVYKELHGDLEVPYEFVVPPEAPWPEDAWGMNLGKRTESIRNREIYLKDRPDRVAVLNRMGFIWNINEEHWQRILKSLYTGSADASTPHLSRAASISPPLSMENNSQTQPLPVRHVLAASGTQCTWTGALRSPNPSLPGQTLHSPQ